MYTCILETPLGKHIHKQQESLQCHLSDLKAAISVDNKSLFVEASEQPFVWEDKPACVLSVMANWDGGNDYPDDEDRYNYFDDEDCYAYFDDEAYEDNYNYSDDEEGKEKN